MSQVTWGVMGMVSEKVQFGQFVLDVDRYELPRAGKTGAIWNVFRWYLLILLVREKGKLISREEIIDRLWEEPLLRHGLQH